jgi:hypothetical protein
MARFVLAHRGSLDATVTLQGGDGEQLTLEEAQVWAALRTAEALSDAARALTAIGDELARIASAMN